jgi:hypothetical protein
MHEHGLRPLKERIEELQARCEQLLQENCELCGRVNGLEWDVDPATAEMEIETDGVDMGNPEELPRRRQPVL